MCKERPFQKKISINNFKLINEDNLRNAEQEKGKSLTEEAMLVAEVFYTPKGYRGEIHEGNPIRVWDSEQADRIFGISKDRPDGDLCEKNFATELAAMHFLTRRLKKLGWEPLSDSWLES